MINITYPNTQFTFTNGTTGSTGNTITSNSINTTSITAQRISTITGTGSSGNILSKTNDNIAWISASSISGNIGSSNLDMQTKNITNATNITCTTIDPTTITTTTFANQTTFTTAPTSVGPTASTQLATKSYVDTKPSTNKNYYLYLNKSQNFTIGNTGYFTLSTTISGATGQGITGPRVSNTNILIGSFMTLPLNITNIPPSLWVLNLYTGLTSLTGTFRTFFELYKYTTTGEVIIGTSSRITISTVPPTFPDLYKMTLSVSSPISLLTTDRLLIKLYYNTNNSTGTYATYYENNWYSYLEIFSNLSCSSVVLGSTATSDLIMNGFNISSTSHLTISCPSKILSIGNKSSTINIGTDTSVTTNINLGVAGTNNIYLNCPLTPSYTNLPGQGEIGQIINFPRVLGKTGIEGQFTMTYTLPYFGRWFVSSTFGIYLLSGSSINGVTLDIQASDGASTSQNFTNYNQLPLTTNTYCFVHNISCMIYNYVTIPNQFTIRCDFIGANGINNFHYNDPSDVFIVRAVRLA